MQTDTQSGDYTTLGGAVYGAFADVFSRKDRTGPLPDSFRIDGKVCLVTGANSGLGKAVAIDLARRGGRVLMACRSGHPQAGKDVSRKSGSNLVEMLKVDLADLDSVHELGDSLRQQGRRLDIIVLNAGLIPRSARRTPQGYEMMFAVHFLANRALIDRLLSDGLIQPSTDPKQRPRIVIVGSEAHRSAGPIDFQTFGAFTDYGLRDSLKHYAASKLSLCTYAQELSRRLNSEGETRVAVNSLCPGPVRSGIVRDAPVFLRLLTQALARLFFAPPDKAARPVIYLCCAEEMGERTGVYLYGFSEKPASPLARDETAGKRLWELSESMIDKQATGGSMGIEQG